MFFEFAMSMRSPWHFHIKLTAISHISLPRLLFCAQTGLRSSCYMRLKCHSLAGNTSACAIEDSSGAGRRLLAGKLSMRNTAVSSISLSNVAVALSLVDSWNEIAAC